MLAFQIASLLPVAAAFGYAFLHMLTRYIGRTESALTMSFYIQVTFLLVCCLFGLVGGNGQFAGHENASVEFCSGPGSAHHSRMIWCFFC